MRPTTLQTALKLRHQAVEAARVDLAAALDEVAQAQRIEKAAIAAIAEEADVATSVDSDDLAVETFSAWLPEGRRLVAAARQATDDAEAHATIARAALTAARTGEAALKALAAQQTKNTTKRRRASDQAALDGTIGFNPSSKCP